MSDFLHNLHNSSDLANIIGFNQRSRALEQQRSQLAQQRHALDVQIAQAEEAARHAGRMEEHTARIEQLEHQRLNLEKQRFEWQMEQEQLKSQKEQRIRDTRKLLCARINELPSLRSACPTNGTQAQTRNIPLTTRLALRQAEFAFLNEQDFFDELPDMQALAQYGTDLAQFISTAHAAGITEENPLDFVRSAIAHRASVLREMAEFLSACRKTAQTLVKTPLHAFTESEVVTFRESTEALRNSVPIQLAEFLPRLEGGKPPLGVDLYSDDLQRLHDVSADLSEFNEALKSANMTEQELVECANQEGSHYQQRVGELTWAVRKCDSWSAARDMALAELAEIENQISKGNHRTAELFHANCPKGVEGFDYVALARVVSKWTSNLPQREQQWESAKLAYLAAEKKCRGFRRTSLFKACESAIEAFLNDFAQFYQWASSLQECEFRDEAEELKSRIDGELAVLRRQVKRAQRRARLDTFVLSVPAIVILLIIGGLLVSIVAYVTSK